MFTPVTTYTIIEVTGARRAKATPMIADALTAMSAVDSFTMTPSGV